MSAGDAVNLIKGQIPDDYHCRCDFCKQTIGELRPEGGGYYSRLERRQYYDPVEKDKSTDAAHIAKTPLHVARWLVQAYTDPGDWVLDPTIGAGTTAVESLTQYRNVAGMEVQFAEALKRNVEKAKAMGQPPLGTLPPPQARLRIGDARRIGAFLDELGTQFSLVVNNPPYSGDESDGGNGPDAKLKGKYKYRSDLPNLAFLKEGPAYWDAMAEIYAACFKYLKVGGYYAYGIKDMMRHKKPFTLHLDFNRMLVDRLKLNFVGTAFLKHYPPTQFISTYQKRYGILVPMYQTVGVFQKPEGWTAP